VSIVDFPLDRTTDKRQGFDFARLAVVLSESSQLLDAARHSDDEAFKDASMELAVRALQAAETAIERYGPAAPPKQAHARLVTGPWPAAAGADAAD
jgi:hypothetical protein